MAIPISGSSCPCPITKTVTVTFTGSSPAPANGYIIGYRKLGSTGAYTYNPSNVSSSPAQIYNVPVCEDIEVVVQSSCNNSQVSSEVTGSVTAYTSYTCSDIITGNHTHNGSYTYPDYLLDVRSSSGTVTITYDVTTLPNRFDIYDSNGNRVTGSSGVSGWVGQANYPGPWGTTNLNTPTTGSFSFTKDIGECFYILRVASVTNTSTNDTFTATVSCPTEGDPPVTPIITYQSCSSGNGQYRIDAPAGYTMKVRLQASGSLTNNATNGSCARIEGSITSSTGPTDTENSAVVSTTGSTSIGAANSLMVDVTVPSVGYFTISTSVFTKNSVATGVSAQIAIYEVNGTALGTPITQSLCVFATSGTVSCGTPTTQSFYATRYVCATCAQDGPIDNYLVAFSNSVTVAQGKFYVPIVGGGAGTYVYLIGASTTDGPGLLMQDLKANTCSQACALYIPPS